MNSGRTIFAQIMDYLPTYEFQQCVERYTANYKVKSFSCWVQFLSMAFAHLTYRESAGYSSLPSHSQTEDLSYGHSGQYLPQHTGSCQPDKRLAHLCRLWPNPHS
ncbi:MAG: DUF4372 domain-containing protein [Fibrobacter sp.]|nr:DUF4372 domain-containing protein [Fibrobacter sp.]